MDGSITEAKNLGKAKSKSDIVAEARERHALAREYWSKNQTDGAKELRFSLGNEQWDDADKASRGTRPTLTINRIVPAIDQVVGDQRQNRPEIKIRPEDNKADKGTAEALNGWIRHVRNASNADIAIDHAFEHMVAGRMGAWQIITDRESDDTMEQTAFIKRIMNPYAVKFDPAAQEWDHSDAMYCFVDELFTEEEFRRRWPDASTGELDSDGWFDGDKIRVTAYWRKVKRTEMLYLMEDGRLLKENAYDKSSMPKPIMERKVIKYDVERYLVNGAEVLEGPEVWPGKYIPIVLITGKEANIDGEPVYRSLTTFAMDPQREYNYAHSTATEAIRLVPTAPYVGTVDQFAGFERIWDDAISKGYQRLPYNSDPQAPGPPKRDIGPNFPPGLMDMLKISSDEIKVTTGYYDASLGQKSNETSGKAILARQREGDVGSFAFIDNLSRGLVYTGKILVDLAPHIIDTQRTVQTLGPDGKPGTAEFNKVTLDPKTGQVKVLNDLRHGRYSVTVSTGPSYSTQRVEAATNYIEFARVVPGLGPVLAVLTAENMDFPGADRLAKAAKSMLPPQVSASMEEGNEQEEQGATAVLTRQLQELQGNVEKIAQVLGQVMQAQQKIGIDDDLERQTKEAKLGGVRLDNERKIHAAAKDVMGNLSQIYGEAPVGTPMRAKIPDQSPEGEGGFY